ASVTPAYRVTPLDALRAALPGVEIVHSPGVGIDRRVPTMPIELHVDYFEGSTIDERGESVHQSEQPAAEFFYLSAPPGVPEPFTARATGTFEPASSGPYLFSLVQAGRARLLVNGDVLIDGITDPMPRD